MRDLETDAEIDDTGNTRLVGRHYRGETFRSLLLTTAHGRRLVIEDSTFERCRTTTGFFLGAGVTLRDVTFVDLDCGDALHLSAHADLTNVTVAGTRPRMLWIKPDAGCDPCHDPSGSPMLDIERFHGEVSITGLPCDRIVADRERHVRVARTLLDTVDWAGLGLASTSYWRLMARKVQADGAEEGVFSLPRTGSSTHTTAVRDLEVLRTHGHLP